MQDRIEALLREAAPNFSGSIEVLPQPKEEFGHYSTSVALRLAKEREENPRVAAQDIVRALEDIAPPDFFEEVTVAGPGFINMWLTPEAIQAGLAEIAANKNFGLSAAHAGQKVIVEFSSPNIAKQMHAGHLRNDALGEALARLHEAQGYKVTRWNYVGDWGTQFGKVIAAYKMWGENLDKGHNIIAQLEDLYKRFIKAEKDDPELAERARAEFKKLEAGDPENRELWNQFRTASLHELEMIYQRFGIKFDEYIGESFFEDILKTIIKRFLEKGLAQFSEGAVIVPLEQFNLPPALIQKTDGASLYLTRDIAALEYRIENYKASRILYVIGNEQALQFEQLFAIAGLTGLDEGVDLRHVKYGLLLGENGVKMSTREGTSVPITDIAEQAVARAHKIVMEKNPDLSAMQAKEIAEKVGLGALNYFMLRENRMSDIRFDWNKILDLTGDSGPYIQYTYARFARLLQKSGEAEKIAAGKETAKLAELQTEHELRLVRKMFQFPEEVRRGAEELMTNNLTTYLYEFANLANRFYEDEPILTDQNAARRGARLLLAATAARVLARGLYLLGIEALETI